jgi:PAS domain S-box-containing protein
MSRPTVVPTGREITFPEHEIIVSKTDLKGIITYANDVFLHVAGYTEQETLGQPHNFIRHPDMPQTVFALLWKTLEAEREIFAYVMNMTKTGDHYWVHAHVTPSYDLTGRHVGYHSNRRSVYVDALPRVRELYAMLRTEERRHREVHTAVDAGKALLANVLEQQRMDYPEFVFSLSGSTTLAAA